MPLQRSRSRRNLQSGFPPPIPFLVQRANAASDQYVTIGQVPAGGSQAGSYSYTDEPAARGTYLYRLIQVDQDDKHFIVGVRAATIGYTSLWQALDKGGEWQLKTSGPARYLLTDEQGKAY